MYIIIAEVSHPQKKKKKLYIYLLGSRYTLYNFDNVIIFDKYFLGENFILVHTFCGHSQFGPYILVAVNLVHIF